jgi:hypothetical protein
MLQPAPELREINDAGAQWPYPIILAWGRGDEG